MPSLNLRTFAPALLATFTLAGSAAAELPVTTSDTDSGLPSEFVVIVEPTDGAVVPGTPDAVVQVVIEYQVYLSVPPYLRLDDNPVPVGDCLAQESPCTLEVTIPPGLHTLSAQIDVDQHTISIEVQASDDTTGGDTGTSSSSSGDGTDSGDGSSGDGPTTSGTSTSGDTGEPGTSGDTDTSNTGSTGNATSGGESDGDKGCACSSRGAPDVLSLGLVALALPWLRRRRR